MTVKNKYPIPMIDNLLDELFGATVFYKVDLRAGYHQVRMKRGEEYKTTFRTHHRLWEFRVMPFILTNALTIFQSLMNIVFKEQMRKFILVIFCDILIHSKNIEEHTKHLEVVLKLLSKHMLFSKLSKCEFGKIQVEYLGHIITGYCVSLNQSKVTAMIEWPQPRNMKALRGFLGLTSYYRKFFQEYAQISKPLTNMLEKGEFLKLNKLSIS